MMGRAIFSDAMPIVKNNNAILAFSKAQSMVKEETGCINWRQMSPGHVHSV